jgi:tetratricopeptide (TPR) repeat protein
MLPHFGWQHAPEHLKLTCLALLTFVLLTPLPTTARTARKSSFRFALPPARLSSQFMVNAQEFDEGSTTIEVAKPIERELKGGQSHAYQLVLEAGQYMHLFVNQKGIDVVVTLFVPDGHQVSEVDSPNGVAGLEHLFLITEMTGKHRLEVRSLDKDASQGRYEVTLEILRVATAQDRIHVVAEKLYAEGDQYLAQNNAESNRQAIEKFEQAAALFHQAGLPSKEVWTLNMIAELYSDGGDKRKALGYVQRALPIAREVGDRLEEAHTLYSLANIEADRGEALRGLEHLNQALQLVRAVGDPDKESSILVALSWLYGSLGEWQKELDCKNQALESSRAAKNLLKESMMLDQLGLYYHQAGDLERSLYYHSQAVSIVKAAEAASQITAGPNWYKPEYINLGFLYSDMGQQDKALDYFQQALTLSREEGDKRDEALILCDIGRTYTRMGNQQKALEINQQALAIAQSLGDVYLQSFALENLGDAYLEPGETPKALDFLKRALSDGNNRQGDFSDAPTIASIARAERRLGHFAEALGYIKTVISIIEKLRMNLKRLDIRTTLLASTSDYYEFYIELLMELHKQHPGAGYDAQALQTSERARARVLVELLTESGANIRQGVDPRPVPLLSTPSSVSWIGSRWKANWDSGRTPCSSVQQGQAMSCKPLPLTGKHCAGLAGKERPPCTYYQPLDIAWDSHSASMRSQTRPMRLQPLTRIVHKSEVAASRR